MRRLSRHRPSPAMVVASIALFVAMGGGAYALTLPANSVGTKQLKKNAVTGKKIKKNAVTSAKVKNGSLTGADVKDNALTGADILESSLGKVPSASSADNAGHATNADNAGHASNADNATNAADSSKLGGIGASHYETPSSVLQPGDTETGVFSATGNVTGGLSAYAIGFKPTLPADIPVSNAHYQTIGTTSTNCPGRGQAASGHLCVYEAANVGSTFEGFFKVTSNSGALVEKVGTIMFWGLSGSQSRVWGTWAVTP